MQKLESRTIRVGVKIEGKWYYRRYGLFCDTISPYNGFSDLAIYEAVKNTIFICYFKATGKNLAKEKKEEVAFNQNYFSVCESISVNFGEVKL